MPKLQSHPGKANKLFIEGNMKRNKNAVQLAELGFSEKALDIVTTGAEHWGNLLYAQLLDDEIAEVQSYLKKYPPFNLNKRSKFETIKCLKDLTEASGDLLNTAETMSSFPGVMASISGKGNEQAFGGKNSEASPSELKKLAVTSANSYREIAVFLVERELHQKNIEFFINRNLNHQLDIEGDEINAIKVCCNCLNESNKLLVSKTAAFLNAIAEYGEFVRQASKKVTSGKIASNVTHTYKIDLDVNGLLPLFAAAIAAVRSINQIRSTNLGQVIGGAHESDNARFGSVLEVARWLSGLEKVPLAQLRTVLLPLDLFPGAVIDDINERALELADEIAFEESTSEIIVNKNVLLKVILAWRN